MKNKKSFILVVGKSPGNFLIADCLSENGYHVKTANSGETALLLANSKTPDLILLDVMTPVIDGCETCLWLKKQMILKNVPIIFLTTQNKAQNKETWFNLGAADYIEKPLIPLILLSCVKKYLTIKHLNNRINFH
jgi:DNA-binding response OmpR family regulator